MEKEKQIAQIETIVPFDRSAAKSQTTAPAMRPNAAAMMSPTALTRLAPPVIPIDAPRKAKDNSTMNTEALSFLSKKMDATANTRLDDTIAMITKLSKYGH